MSSHGTIGRFALVAVGAAIVLSCGAKPGWSQNDGLHPGTRVRVATLRWSDTDHRSIGEPDGKDPFGYLPRITGRLSGIRNDTLFVIAEPESLPEAIPLRAVHSIDTWTRGNQARAGAILGFVSGAIMGGYVGHEMASPETTCQEIVCIDLGITPLSDIAGVIFGGATGALVGWAFGSSIPAGWHWQANHSVRMGPTIQGPSGFGIGLSVRF